jgi:hypothetical protein
MDYGGAETAADLDRPGAPMNGALYTWISGNADEFVHTRPRQRPGRGAFHNRPHHGQDGVIRRICPMGKHQQVRIDGDHAPRPR